MAQSHKMTMTSESEVEGGRTNSGLLQSQEELKVDDIGFESC